MTQNPKGPRGHTLIQFPLFHPSIPAFGAISTILNVISGHFVNHRGSHNPTTL